MPDFNERVHAGEYVDAEGHVLGTHSGFVNYTIGQRKGLGIALGHPAYVTHIDAVSNRVTLGSNEDMYASSLRFWLVTPLRPYRPDQPLLAKIRYRTSPVEVSNFQIIQSSNNQIGSLSFSEPVWGVTLGQSVVFYQNDLLIGGGIIIN